MSALIQGMLNSISKTNQKSKKSDMKLAQYAAKINNYYNNKLNNSENSTGFLNKYSKNYFEKINKKRSSLPEYTNNLNLNFKK